MMSIEFVISWAGAGVAIGALLASHQVGLSDRSGRPVSVLPALLTGALFAAAAGRFEFDAEVIAFSYVMALGVAACMVDLAERRLPSELILPGYVVVGVCVLTSAAAADDKFVILRVLSAGLMSFAFHLLLALASRGGLGAGDVKLAGLLGFAAGWLSWTAVLAAIFLAWATAVVAVLLRPYAIPDRRLAMGPFLFAGFVTAALAGV